MGRADPRATRRVVIRDEGASTETAPRTPTPGNHQYPHPNSSPHPYPEPLESGTPETEAAIR
ncbi:hypothetical protein EHYA_05762 [Embleya hyalina]|uniref:Uncharacterized protein n=1 Tax=Embleya hyalina TaxID=516124 RepID=A0A401YU00_9ACTN|nr:hypothetical protein EHYA_05762 [Embleya hyalina]